MTVLVVMGVSGSGKSTVARMLAARLDWPYIDGDELHPQHSIDKMAQGQALTDSDRAPWLDAVAGWIDSHLAAHGNGVVTCSALRRRYRDVLRRPEVVFVYLHGDTALIADRMRTRHGHFMPLALLNSQVQTLEAPDSDERVISVDVAHSPSEIVDMVLAELAAG